MTLRAEAWGHDGETFDGQHMRQLVAAFASPGVVGVADLVVTEQAAPDDTVMAAGGLVIVEADGAGLFGRYLVANVGAETSPAFTPTSGDGRIDEVIVRVTAGVPAIEIVEGTPAGSPSPPAIAGDNFEHVARVTLPPTTSVVDDSMILDMRRRATLAHDLADDAVTSAKIADEAVTPEKIATDAWTAFTPALAGTAVVSTSTVFDCARLIEGRRVTARYIIRRGASSNWGSDTGGMRIQLPVPMAAYDASSTICIGHGSIRDVGTRDYGVSCLSDQSVAPARDYMVLGNIAAGNRVNNSNPMAWATGDNIDCTVVYEGDL